MLPLRAMGNDAKVRRLPVISESRGGDGAHRLPLAADSRPIDRARRPRVAVWELTLRCNLSCIHCGSRAGRPRSDELSTEECLGVVDQLAALSVLEVSLIGGEAHLHPGFLEIVRALTAHGIEVGMTTGGRGIDRELARKTADAGIASVSVSLDGLAPTHDGLRGLEGSFREALAAIAPFQSAGVHVAVNTQINRANQTELEPLLETLIEARARAWQVALTVAMGRAADRPELLLQPYDLLALFPRLAQVKRRCDEASVLFWPGNNIGYFGPYEHVFRGQMPLGHCYSCGAGLSTLGIEADGTVKGCP